VCLKTKPEDPPTEVSSLCRQHPVVPMGGGERKEKTISTWDRWGEGRLGSTKQRRKKKKNEPKTEKKPATKGKGTPETSEVGTPNKKRNQKNHKN